MCFDNVLTMQRACLGSKPGEIVELQCIPSISFLRGCRRAGGPARAASGGLVQGAWPTYLHPRLASTRALERFRNQARCAPPPVKG